MQVAIVGGGIFGQVIAWRLAARGHQATVIEPLGPGNGASASGDRSRIVRALYDEPCFAEAGHVGLERWKEWSIALGVRLIEPTGVLYFDRSGDAPGAVAFRAWLDRGVANVRSLGGVAEEIAPAEAARRWPAIAIGDLARVVFEPAGGFGRPALACRAVAQAALATGRVEHVPLSAERVIVRGTTVAGVAARDSRGQRREISADAVVIAAGFFGVALIRELVGELGIQRLPHWTSYWDVPYPAGADLSMGRLPVWIDLGASLYGLPDDGESGFKIAWHEPRQAPEEAAKSPRAAEEAPSAEQLEALREAAEMRFPALVRAACRGTFCCAYDATADEMFQIGPVPGISRLWFVGGLSGHGYKHAPSLGESVAAQVTEEAPALRLERYALRV